MCRSGIARPAGAAGGAALGVGGLLQATGALDDLPRFAALFVAGVATTAACGITFVSLDERVRHALGRFVRHRSARRPAGPAAEPDA